MKQLSVLLVLVCIVIMVGCSNRGIEPAQRYTISIEDHETAPYEFPWGVYYSFVFPEPQSFVFDVDSIFNLAADRGVRLRDAWYKSYRTECAPLRSIISMPIIISGGFVVRVDELAPVLQKIGFVETSDPNVGECAYRVRHYHFED
jgi:hypothetical protein